MLRICSLLVFCLLPVMGQAQGFGGRVSVVDGDTFAVGEVRVRLFGVDAPEAGQPCRGADGRALDCGGWVTRQVRALYQGAEAHCEALDRDRYDRVVARCTVGGQDVARHMVSEGLAYAYRRYSMDYDLEEKAALVAGRGIHGFTLDRPEGYRAAARAPVAVPVAGCAIKGNISSNGRIYHVPGQRDHARTVIDPQRGERMFCSEAEARAAGWRAARR
jgi:endonuclease YncB( thermonuclease family)